MRQGKYPFIIGFLAAPVTLYVVFVIWPYIQTFQISLTNWNGFSTPTFIGLDNYKNLFHDDTFIKAVTHHVKMLIALPLVTLIIALAFSYLLNLGGNLRGGRLRGVRFAGTYKILYFMPQVLAVAIVGVLFSNVYQEKAPGSPPGVLNSILGTFHIPQVSFLTNPGVALWSVIGVMVWQAVGFYVVLFSAAMASIPKDLFEAASLDGASRLTLFFRITLPLLWDTLQVGWIYLSIAAFDGFALVQVMSINQGEGPEHSTSVLPLEIYQKGINQAHPGYASAMGVALFFMTITIAALIMGVTRRDRIEL